MLEELFGSKTRIKLLKFLYSHPDECFYIRELGRKVDSQINAVRRELNRLEKLGIIVVVAEPVEKKTENDLFGANKAPDKKKKAKKTKKNVREKKFFQINRAFILFPELKALFLKSQLLVEKDLVERIRKIGTIYYLALGGVFMGFGDASTDLFVVGTINKNKMARLIARVEKELEMPINYTIMNKKEFKYRKDITDRFLYGILESKKIVVVDKLNVGEFEDERIKAITSNW